MLSLEIEQKISRVRSSKVSTLICIGKSKSVVLDFDIIISQCAFVGNSVGEYSWMNAQVVPWLRREIDGETGHFVLDF